MNDKIDAIIIDDEENFTAALEILIRKHFPKINIVAEANTVKSGVAAIIKYQPKLVFLDINLPDGSGFDILDKTTEKSYEIIFTTAFTEFAFRAFEVSALHYLMKPMTVEKLREAIERYERVHEQDFFDEKLQVLKQSLLYRPEKILLPTAKGTGIFNISDIIYCEAVSNYCTVFFIDGSFNTLTKPLQYLDKILNDLDFVRIHSRYLINMRYVHQYLYGRNAQVQLTNQKLFPISQIQKPIFLERLKQFAKS